MKNTEYTTSKHHASRRLEGELTRSLPQLMPPLRMGKAMPRARIGGATADLGVDIVTPAGRRRRLYIDVKTSAAPSRIRESIRQLKAEVARTGRGYALLASTFLSPRAREICREEGAGYVDLAGNCLLQFDDFYFEKVVERNPFPQRGRPASVFTPISSRILRVLLEEPRRAWKLGELARMAHVSLGQTSNVCQRLTNEAYIEKSSNGLKLREPGKLLDAWRDHYTIQSQPAAYYSFQRDPERLMNRIVAVGRRQHWPYALTSFGAASLVAPFIHGIGTVQWYVADRAAVDAWAKALDLRPVESGPNALVFVPHDPGVFYRVANVQGKQLVGLIQLYLDLFADPGRGREQAEFLRKKRLGF